MLAGKQPLNLKQALHAVENAYLDNPYPYAEFDGAITKMA